MKSEDKVLSQTLSDEHLRKNTKLSKFFEMEKYDGNNQL